MLSYARRSRSTLTIAVTMLLAIFAAGSWLLAVYLLDGRGILDEVKIDLQQGRAGGMQSVQSILARGAPLSHHVDMLALYGTAEFFEVANRQARGISYDPTADHIFLVNENTHMDELPLSATPVMLRVNGGELFEPTGLETLTYSIHHKLTVATFPKAQFADLEITRLELLVPPVASGDRGWAYTEGEPVAVSWDLPIDIPRNVVEEQIPFSTSLAVALGLLATVLTPCLLQLLVFYLSTLTGMSAEQLSGAKIDPKVRGRLFQIALGFVAGYTLLFTGAGALAGIAGDTLQNLFSTWTRPLAIGSGLLIVGMGVWMGIRARAPLFCRIPLGRAREMQNTKIDGPVSFARASAMGLLFAVGCSTCFGGALLGTLLLYVGTIGSAAQGAFILFLFSLGVGIPFLISAALLTRVMPHMQKLHRMAPAIGFASAAIVIVFGVLLMTDNFHVVSAWLTPYLGV